MRSIVRDAVRRRPRTAGTAGVLLLATVVFCGAYVGIELTRQTDRVASVWLSNGFVLVVLLACARRRWPAILAAGTAGNLLADLATGDALPTAAFLAGCNLVEIVVAGAAIRRRVGPAELDLTRPRHLATFAMGACHLGPLASTLLAATFLHVTAGADLWRIARQWFTADALGMALVVPLGVAFLAADLRRLLARTRRFDVPLTFGPLLITTAAVFAQSDYPLLFCVLPPLFFAVSRLGAGGATVGSLLVATVAVAFTVAGFGPLSLVQGVSVGGRIFLLQCFLLVANATALWMAALVGEGERLARALREGEARFRLLAEHASDVVSRIEPDGNRSYVSSASSRIFGVPPGWLYERDLLTFVVPDDVAAVERTMDALLSGRVEQARVRYRAQHPTRGEVWLEEVGRASADPLTGALDGYVAVTRDVTESVRAALASDAHARELEAKNASLDAMARNLERLKAEAEQASRVKTQFLASVSHELRTPLNGVLGYAHLLRLGGRLDPVQDRQVAAMLDAGQHLLDMINRVLTLSEIETGRSDARWDVVDPADLARSCVELIRPSALLKNLHLALDVPAVPVPPIVTDPTRLRQVLLNLLGNAVKYTAGGKIELRLRARPEALRLEVIDTGVGITADRRARLFTDFERLGQEVTGVEGAGLGLALSSRLAARLGGSLGYAPNPEGGSIFSLELPRTVPGRPDPSRSAPPPPSGLDPDPEPRAPQPLHVLVADDVAMNREVAATFLRSAGHLVTCVAGGRQAVEAAAAADYDLVFMDVRMPDIDGLEATRRIRALPGNRAQVPVVALTAQAFSEQVAECRAAGMTGHLSKPFTPDAILATAARVARPGLCPEPVGA